MLLNYVKVQAEVPCVNKKKMMNAFISSEFS